MMAEDAFGVPVTSRDPKIDRLEDSLELPLWTSAQAVMILAGLYIESTGECRDSYGSSYHYRPLPGVCEASCDTLDFHNNINSTMDLLRGFIRGESQLPSHWIDKVQEKGIDIPWIDVAHRHGLLNGRQTKSERRLQARIKGGFETQRRSPQASSDWLC